MKIKIFKFNPEIDTSPHYQKYEVNTENKSLTVKEVIEIIARDQDPSLSFFHHSTCNHSSCKRCLVRINGKTAMACSTVLPDSESTVQIDPVNKVNPVRDIVVKSI